MGRISETIENLIELETSTLLLIKDEILSVLNSELDTEQFTSRVINDHSVTASQANSILKLFLYYISNSTQYPDFKSEILEEINSVLESLDESQKAKASLISSWFEDELIKKRASLLYKVTELKMSNPKTFYNSRVISDLRPICFGRGDNIDVESVCVIHNLNIQFINYQKPNKKRSFAVSLSIEDLRSLKKEIERAERKEELYLKKFQDLNFIKIK